MGLFGYRVLLVNRNTPDIIKPTSSLEHIKRLKAAQGRDWPDAKILQENGFNVLESGYEDAFRLLNKGYIDFFPRGITEVTEELVKHPGLMLESQHILRYPNIMYFFVSRSNAALARRIELGLSAAKADGSYQNLLNHTPFIQRAQAIIQNRQIHELDTELSEQSTRVFAELFN